MSDNRASTYLENDIRIWRASSFGYCEQYLARVAKGQTPDDPPEKIIAAMEVSAALEGDVLTALEGRGYRVLTHEECGAYGNVNPRNGQIGTELKVPGGIIRCHPDAIVQPTDSAMAVPQQHMAVEVKCLSAKTTDDPLKRPAYSWQFAIEMASTGLPGLFVVAYKDEDGVLVYEGDRVKLDIGYHKKPPWSKGQILGRAARLNKLIGADTLPACDFKMYPCGFWSSHNGGIWEDEVTELATDVTATLEVLANDWKDAKDRGAAAKKKKESTTAAMKAILKECGVEEGARVKVADFTLTLAQGKSTKYSEELAEKDGVDLSKYKTETPYTYVLPKEKK